MPGNLFIAIGTHRSKAEDWIATLPERFPDLHMQTISPEQLADLPEHPDDSCAVVSEPYTDPTHLQAAIELAAAKGWETYLEYFPAEPLFPLIQRDLKSGNIIGAPALKEEIRTLRPFSAYQDLLNAVE